MKEPQGPRRRQWEKMKLSHDRAVRRIEQFNTNLESIKQNNPACANLAVKPIPPIEPLPPMPEWEE